jgi:hypothetical protein
MTATKLALAMSAVALSWMPSAAGEDSQPFWPGWRGPNRDGVSKETGLLKEWPKEGPKLLWSFNSAGAGYGSVAIVGDEIFLLGADGDGEFIKKVDLAGKEIGRAKLDKGEYDYAKGWGEGPRSTPWVDGEQVYALSSDGRLVCFDRKTLSEKWSKSLPDEFGKGKPRAWWGYSESPLIDGDKIVVTPGGKNCVVALNKNSGETIWKSTGVEDDQQYASLMPMTVDGTKMYVTQTASNMIGVDAETGKLLWKFGEIGRRTAVIPTPIIAGNRVYVTAGYGAGCECVDVEKSGDGFEAKKVFVNRNMANHHGGVILIDGHVYGSATNDVANSPWVCQKLADGSVAWKHQERSAGKGSIAFADGRFYLFEEKPGGSCILIEASPAAWKELGRFKLPQNSKLPRGRGSVWAHPVVVGGKLYLRDLDLLFCFDVKGQ